jgi:hypothetical protein
VTDNGKTKVSPAALTELIESATVLSEDHGELVSVAVREAVEHPLDEERAQRLYTRIVKILRGHDADGLTDAERERIADEVRAEVEKVVSSVERPKKTGGLELITHNGLTPRPVVPVPTFNNKAIPMTEGYVDVEKLQLWPGNHRLALAVAEFEERNGRSPEPDELLKLMQGSILMTGVKNPNDPFKLKPLADSIARKGVETPPIVTFDGEPKDGNRRIAAALLILHGKAYSSAEKERARYIRVWRAPKGTTDDQFEAIVVSRNFESDYKEDWPEFIKGRLVVQEYELRKRQIKGRISRSELKRIREELAKDFAIKPAEVERYDKMIYWADDFSAYHEGVAGRDPAVVRTKTEKNFQWFYEIDAGRGNEKLTRRLEGDDELKSVVYDLMFEILDSGAQVRDLYRVVNDAESARMLLKAHELKDTDPDRSLELVEDAITEAKRRNVKRRSIGFEDYLKAMVDRLGSTPPDQWDLDTELLLEVRRIMEASLGAIDAQLSSRRSHGEEVEA